MASTTKRLWTIRIFIVVLVAVVLLFPLPVRDGDKERVIARSAQRLHSQQRILLDWKYIPFYDAALIAERKPKWHFINDTDLDIFKDSAFHPMSRSEFEDVNVIDWYQSNALIEITTRDSVEGNGAPCLRFNVSHGWLGAQGYRIRIHRCILGLFARYDCEWVS